MKFGQLIEHNKRNISVKKSFKNVAQKLFPVSFLKNQNLVYLWINSLKFYAAYFYCILIYELSKYSETKLLTTLFF